MALTRPTFHESWYRVNELKPRLRAAVQTSRQHFRGRTWHVVEDPTSTQYFRLDDAAFRFVALLDGRRTVEEAWRICGEQFGDAAPTQGEAINLLGQLYVHNLLRSDLPADAAGMLENQRTRTRRAVGGTVRNLLFLRIPLFDPDALLGRWEPVLGLVFTRTGFVAWLTLIIAAAVSLAGRGAELLDAAAGMLAPGNLVLLYLGFAAIKAIHELGHGVACKRLGRQLGHGGHVRTFGLTLLVFTPVPYMDASSSWAFPDKWQRSLVGAAGMYVELAAAAIAAIVWANTSPGTVHALAYNAMFVASVSTLVFNGNPLMRFDGYYILSDVLEIPNLAQRSREQLHYLVRRHVFGVTEAAPAALDSAEQWWLPTYSVASLGYRVLISVGIVMFLLDHLFVFGVALACGAVFSWLVVPFEKFARYVLASPELAQRRRRAVLTTAAAGLMLLAGVGVVPAPDRARAEAVVEPIEVTEVFAAVDGFVGDVMPGGRDVEPDGPPLIVARNAELEVEREKLIAERELTLVQRDQAAISEVALAQSLTERLGALDRQIERVERQLEALSIHAPLAGRWIAPDIARRRGSFVRRGDAMGVVADVDRVHIRAIADQRLGPRIEPELGVGAVVQVRVLGRPELMLTGRIREVLPAGSRQLPSAALGYLAGGATAVDRSDSTGRRSTEPFFEILIDPEDDAGLQLCSGQRVVVRFELPSRPLAVQAWRSVRQLVQRRFGT